MKAMKNSAGFELGKKMREQARTSASRESQMNSGRWSLVVTAPGSLDTPAGRAALVVATTMVPSRGNVVEKDRPQWIASAKWYGKAAPSASDFAFIREFAHGAGALDFAKLDEVTRGGWYWMWEDPASGSLVFV